VNKNKNSKTLSLKVARYAEKRLLVKPRISSRRELISIHREKKAFETNLLQPHTQLTKGQKAADSVTTLVGSWKFIIIQSLIILIWISWNSLAPTNLKWDPPSFLLLNILLSFQAAYTAPFIMMSENRQSQIDRRRAKEDFEVNKLAERENEVMLAELRELKKMIRQLRK
jgi:uncharacterized membrane protein